MHHSEKFNSFIFDQKWNQKPQKCSLCPAWGPAYLWGFWGCSAWYVAFFFLPSGLAHSVTHCRAGRWLEHRCSQKFTEARNSWPTSKRHTNKNICLRKHTQKDFNQNQAVTEYTWKSEMNSFVSGAVFLYMLWPLTLYFSLYDKLREDLSVSASTGQCWKVRLRNENTGLHLSIHLCCLLFLGMLAECHVQVRHTYTHLLYALAKTQLILTKSTNNVLLSLESCLLMLQERFLSPCVKV